MDEPMDYMQLARLWTEEQQLKRDLKAKRELLTQALRDAHAAGQTVTELCITTAIPESTISWRIYGPPPEARRVEPLPNGEKRKRQMNDDGGPGMNVSRAAEVLGVPRQRFYSWMRSGKTPVLQTDTGVTRIPLNEDGTAMPIPEGYLRTTNEDWPKMELYAAKPADLK